MKLIFRQKFKVNDETSISDPTCSTGKRKCKKLNRSITLVFGLLAFVALISVTLYYTLHPRALCASCDSSCTNKTRSYSNRKYVGCTLNKGCEVLCENIKEEKDNLSVADYINSELEQNECDTILQLTIMSTKFNQSQINKGWLESIRPKVQKLEISYSTIKKINKEAFVGHPFHRSLRDLLFANTDIEVLTKDSFLGLDTLSSFAFREDIQQRTKYLTLEHDVLQGMSKSLSNLEFTGYILTAESIQNLTGTDVTSFLFLKIVSLQHNRITELGESSFTAARNLELLSLADAGLTEIHREAFRGMNNMKKLRLEKNNLETIPQSASDSFKKLNDKDLFLSENPWKCDCSLQWLQKDYRNKINPDEVPLCHDDKNSGKTFDQADFCPESSTTALSSPTTSNPFTSSLTTTVSLPSTSSSTGSTGLLPKYTTIKCQDRKKSLGNSNSDVIHQIEVTIRNENIHLEFHELQEEFLEIELRTTEDLSDYHLLWFNVENKSEAGCRSPVEDNMIITGLTRSTTYSFGLLYDQEPQVSPKCTFCIKTEPDWKHRPWILNKYRAAIISSTVFVGIFLILLAAFITFLCILRHPKIIASNKNVIIVKPKKNSEDATPPREYEKPAYWDSYLIPASQGYLTPKFHRYAKVKYRPPLMRSVSEWSVTSANQTYDDPRYTQGLHMLRALRQNQREIVESDTYDYRPPLPPPNPGWRKPSAPLQENIYSSV